MNEFDKILGAFLGAAVGDAMGAPTEMRTTEQIIEYFGGPVREFKEPPSDTFARGRKPGQVTDDFSLAYFLAKAIIKHHGKLDFEVVKESLLEWGNTDEYFIPFAGPTTRAAIERLKGNEVKNKDEIVNFNATATNGSAMKIFPVGLLNPGNLDKAIEDAAQVCMPTHNNHLSISGACAVAAAVSKAMANDADVYSIVQAGLYGARKGEEIGRKISHIVAGPSVVKRMELAIEIGLKSSSMEEAMQDIGDYVGSGLHISEAVPAVFGLFVAGKGKTMDCIYAGVNIGNDTDTVATMVGALTGAYNGYASMPEEYLTIINERNNINLEKLAQEFERIVRRD
jgi:ADP-ribosylglycohydrolase